MNETTFDLVLRGDVVTAEAVIGDAFVAVRDGTIAAVGTGPVPAADRVDDHRGCLLFPGLVDAQVHSGSFEGARGATRRDTRGGGGRRHHHRRHAVRRAAAGERR